MMTRIAHWQWHAPGARASEVRVRPSGLTRCQPEAAAARLLPEVPGPRVGTKPKVEEGAFESALQPEDSEPASEPLEVRVRVRRRVASC
jgi:hypothetical protein